MARKKYIFNPQTSEYEEFSTSWQKKLRNVFLYILSAGSMALIAVFISLQFIGSPKERVLNREVEYLNLQFAIMNEKIDEINVLMDEIKDRDDNIYRALLGTEAVAPSIRQAGFGGSDRYSDLEGYSHSDMVINTAKKLDVLASQISVQLKSYDEVYEMAINKSEMSSVNNTSSNHGNPFDVEKTAFYREGDLEVNITTPADTIYENDSIQLFAEAVNGTGHLFAWEPAEYLNNTTIQSPLFTAPNISNALESFTLTCQIIDTVIQDTAQGSITINVLDYMIADINSDSSAITINYGEEVVLEAVTEGSNPDNFVFNWTPGTLVDDSTSHSTQSVPLRASTSFTLSVRNIYSDDIFTDVLDVEVIGEDMYAEFSVAADTICENESTQLTATAFEGTGNYTYSWTPSADLDSANIATPTYYPMGIHDIIETMSFICTISDGVTSIQDTVYVSVMDYLAADAADDSLVVDYGEIIQLRAFYGNVDTSNFVFNWSPDTLVETPNSFNTYTLPLVDTTTFVLSVNNKLGSCVSTDTVNVFVDGVALYASAYINDSVLCDDEFTQLSVEAFEGTGEYSYRWIPADMLDCDTIPNPTFIPDSIVYDDLFRFYCEVSDGITKYNTEEVSVMVYRSPNAYFSNDSLTIICAGNDMTFYAPNDNTSSTIFSWSVVDANGQAVQLEDPSSSSLTHIFDNEGTFVVSLTASLSEECGGCEDSHSVIIEVIDAPEVEFYPEDIYSACIGEELFFTAPENPEGTSYYWHISDTAGVVLDTIIGTEFSYIFTEFGDYSLSLTATFGEGSDSCSASDTLALDVNEMPDALFSVTDMNVCSGNELTFFAPQNTEGTTYLWSIKDENSTFLTIDDPTVDSLVFQFDTVGVHTVILTATLGNCINTDSINVNVLFTPDVMFLEDDVVVCSDVTVDFIAPETNLEGTVYEWIVALADTTTLYESIGDTLSYIFNDSLSYIVSLSAYYGQGDEMCEDEHSVSVSVSKTPPAFINILNATSNDSIAYGIHYGDTAMVSANGGVFTDTIDYHFQWEPADLFNEPNSVITQTKQPLIEPLAIELIVTNRANGMCQNIVFDTIKIIDNKFIITDTICNDGASYVDGRYWLFDEEGWDFNFPGHYKGLGEWTFDTENGVKMNVDYDLTLLNEFKVSEIGNGNNAEVVYHYGLGYDLYEFRIDDVTGGGTDEFIEGFTNAKEAYKWDLQMIEGSKRWILNHNENMVTVNVQSEGSALLECKVYSYALSIDTIATDTIPTIISDTIRISDTVTRWMLLYTPGHRPCNRPTDLNVNAVSGQWAHVYWQSYADSCIVQYSTNEDFSASSEIVTRAKNIVLEGLNNNTTYYWRVASICGDSELEYVIGLPFTTQEEGVGIDENLIDNILMYPNPASDNVTIKGDNIKAIEIYNCVGVRVYSNKEIIDNSTIINTNDMNGGLYIVRILTDNGQLGFKRLIIE